jgi:hypothetical protein
LEIQALKGQELEGHVARLLPDITFSESRTHDKSVSANPEALLPRNNQCYLRIILKAIHCPADGIIAFGSSAYIRPKQDVGELMMYQREKRVITAVRRLII